ncbi:MAG TPA: glycosyltransferase, partial [Candidatus Paceibacterota bacterium]|nr:glycosyltransferase [Candidatus Paceibacterota bacterium]
METLPESRPSTISLAGKRVLFAITKSNWGGAQAYVAMMARGARDAGAEVAVMAGAADGRRNGDSGRLFEVLAADGIRTIPLSDIQRDINTSSEWAALKELVTVIRKEKPDILHLNSSKMGVLGAIAGRRAGVKRIIFTAHGWPYKETRSPLWKIMAWGGSWLTILLSSRIVAVTDQDLRDSPTLLFRDKLRMIHNGISDFPRLSREDARLALQKYSHDISNFPQLLIMNAELHMNKGIGTAIRALSELAHHHPDLALVVCGEGDARAYL